jgi:hypothetical protein
MTQMVQATMGFYTHVAGEEVFVPEGRIFDSGDDEVKGTPPDYWQPVMTHRDRLVEQATAAPGETRNVRLRTRKVEKAAPKAEPKKVEVAATTTVKPSNAAHK